MTRPRKRERFDAAPALEPLKDFQRETAEYVFDRLYRDPDTTRRFLVADEVGLGKTLVARGVIAKTIEHLQDVVERVDIVYVCSNALIAKQNLQRLRVGQQEHFELAQRITMLPATAHRLAENRINLISFTPGTSFDLKGGGGMARERALLRLMMAEAWGHEWFRRRGTMRVFQGGVRTLERFRNLYRETARRHHGNLNEELVERFAQLLEEQEQAAAETERPGPWERFEELAHTFGHGRPRTGWTWQERRARNRFIGEMRDLLARACLEALRPDLIVLDEFQRFKHLLATPGSAGFTPAAELAHELFDHVDSGSGSQARVLLLSATPYKMLTTQADTDEDHHDDLVETVRFLLDNDEEAVDQLRRDLRGMRRGLLQVGRDGGAAARAARDAVEATLRRVMVRTERLAATPDRSGMLVERPCDDLHLDVAEVGRFVANARLSRELDVPDPLEYWKSAPYLLNFAEQYKLRKEFDAVTEAEPHRLAPWVREAGALPFDELRSFRPVPFDNARLRWLVDDTVGRAWQLLWVPPSLPYLEPSGPYANPDLRGFSKRLVFSTWRMVPTAITTLLTYEAERRMVSAHGEPRFANTPEARQSRARLLEFTWSNERLTGMPVLGIMYPSVVLAREGDPLRLCAERDGTQVPADEAVKLVADRLRSRLDGLVRTIEEGGGSVTQEGRGDRWYWAAPMLLDWLEDVSFAEDVFQYKRTLFDAFTGGESGGGRFLEHLDVLRALATRRTWPHFEAMPADLPEVLARIALAGPGVAAMRALARATDREVGGIEVRLAAARVAWGWRTLFNQFEVNELIHHLYPDEPYWQRTLDYGIAGNLQAVLDEYAHVLIGARGHVERSGDDALHDIAQVMHDALTLRTVRYGVSRVDLGRGGVTVTQDRLRANFALRLTDERGADGSQIRVSEVREAFNSPFRPFVLATTSAGQEGLDFHTYCHAVVHWNLPGNPVDLEQREGRVHRFEGHAIRRNIATIYSQVGRTEPARPWRAMMEAAHADRPADLSDIVPHWIYCLEGGASVERFVPALPLSRDRARAEALQRAVASYRLAFGQPRQDDLLAYLADELDPETLARLAGELRIDLSPMPAND